MTALATADQVRAIKATQGRLRLAEGDYRAALGGFGVTSCKQLTVEQAAAFLDRLNGGRAPGERPSNLRATGRYAGKLQVLWIAAWNLGIIRNRDDAALLEFVRGQAKVDHTRFLLDPADAKKVIEAIKAMLARDGGVRWPRKPGPDAIELKRAIVAAQYQRLAARAIYPDMQPFDRLTPKELDALSRRLGVLVRRHAPPRPQPEGEPS